MLKELIKLANNLDEKGLRAEADYLDGVIQKLGQDRPEIDYFEKWVSKMNSKPAYITDLYVIVEGTDRGAFSVDDRLSFADLEIGKTYSTMLDMRTQEERPKEMMGHVIFEGSDDSPPYITGKLTKKDNHGIYLAPGWTIYRDYWTPNMYLYTPSPYNDLVYD